MTNTPPSPPKPSKKVRRLPLWLAGLVAGAVGLLALLLGIGLGAVVGADVEATTAYQELESELAAAESSQADVEVQLADAADRVESLESENAEIVRDIPEREEAVTDKEKVLDRRSKKLRRREREVTEREKAVSEVENRIAANTFSDGVYEVGADVEPGTYRKQGGTGCYYAILNSTNTNDIATNNLTDGPAVVTLSAETYFQSTRCGEWVLQP